jgi:hypothetical protein
MSSIDGIELFPIISLVIFVSFFILLLLRLYVFKGADYEQFSKLPLEDDFDYDADSPSQPRN